MRIAVSGATGFIGRALVPYLTTAGHDVVRLVRSEPGEGDVLWNPRSKQIGEGAWDGVDAVVHMAGENLGAGRWTPPKKERIKSSRVEGTRFLCEALAAAAQPPKVLVSASAIGFYGDRGDEVLDEESGAGRGFLAEVGREWEEATEPARRRGIRVVQLRMGIVLSPAGGVLARLLPLFRAGAAGIIGGGGQYVSWIAMDDLLRIVSWVLENEELCGPINAVSPHPVSNRTFTETLGRVINRTALIKIPALVLKVGFGEAAEETVLASTRVVPKRLLEQGFRFRHPTLEGALRHLLGMGPEVEWHEARESI